MDVTDYHQLDLYNFRDPWEITEWLTENWAFNDRWTLKELRYLYLKNEQDISFFPTNKILM